MKKKAREIWYMCRKYSAQEALEMGLVNKVVPHEQLADEVQKWCDEIMEKAPPRWLLRNAHSTPIQKALEVFLP